MLNSFAHHQPGKMPSLKKLLAGTAASDAPKAPAERQSLAEMAANVRAWRAVLNPGEAVAGPPPAEPPREASPEKEQTCP